MNINQINEILNIIVSDRCTNIMKKVYYTSGSKLELSDIQRQIYIHAFKDGISFYKKTKHLA